MMKSRASRFLWLASAVVFAAGCGGSSDSPAAPAGGFGTITGKVTAGDGTTPVALASVYVESKGKASAVTSDAQGAYSLTEVPAGSQVVVAEKGNFKSSTPVTVSSGKTVAAPAAKLAPTGKLGYVLGSFDSIQHIIQQLGYTAEPIAESSLSNSTLLNQYKMIFLNCGSFVDVSHAAALKAWVQAGGTLYASDWELDVIQAMFPNDILSVGSGQEGTVTATITNTALQQFTGKTSVQIQYDLGAWKMLKSISNTPTVLLRGNVVDFDSPTPVNQALAISFTLGQGKVVYTTFHNEAGITADQRAVLNFFIHF